MLPWLQNNQQSQLPWLQQSLQQAQPSYNFDNLAGILKSLAASKYNFSGANLAPQAGAANQISDLARAQYDQNHPLFQQIYGQERQQGQQDLAASVAELARQNRRLSSMGRTPLFSPERGGETIFRGVTQGYQDIQNQARNRAREVLQAGQMGQARAYDAFSALSQGQQQNKKKKAFGWGNVADMLPLLGKFL